MFSVFLLCSVVTFIVCWFPLLLVQMRPSSGSFFLCIQLISFDELVDPGCFEVGRIKNVAEEGMKPVNFGDILATLYHT